MDSEVKKVFAVYSKNLITTYGPKLRSIWVSEQDAQDEVEALAIPNSNSEFYVKEVYLNTYDLEGDYQ